MKVLVLAPRPLWPVHDGGTVATVQCIRGLASAGASVSVLSMQTEKHDSASASDNDQPPAYVTRYMTVPVDTMIKPLRLLGNLLFSGDPYDVSRFISADYSEALRTWLREMQFDIIQCEGLTLVSYLVEIRRLTGVPVVLRAHNIEHKIREMQAANTRLPLHRAYLANLARRLLKTEIKAALQFDAVVPISEPDFRWFSAVAGGKPVFLAETGTETTGYLPEDSGGNPSEPSCGNLQELSGGNRREHSGRNLSEHSGGSMRVGFIGAMNWQPNIEGIKWFIAKVWPSVLAKIPSATLHLAGRGLDKQSAILPEGENIVIEGEPEDARTFISSNHVIIAPLFAGSGQRIKITEAMSAGRPVVATPAAVYGLPVENGRELIIASEPESFSGAVVRLLEDPSLRAEIINAALTLVHGRYDNSAITSRLLEFYKELTHGS